MIVCLQGLLQAHEHLPGASFEELLCEADAAGQPKRAPGANARMLPVSLLHAPHVFVLALVWESPQVCGPHLFSAHASELSCRQIACQPAARLQAVGFKACC